MPSLHTSQFNDEGNRRRGKEEELTGVAVCVAPE